MSLKFDLKAHQSDLKREMLAGATTFLTMAYIIFVNSSILAEAGMDKNALVVVTCLASAFATIIVGLFANAPIAMAPGMGLNAFFAYGLVLGGQCNWQTALGVVFLSGVFFLILTLTGLRKKLIEAIPSALIAAISVGIGLFITFIGLVKLGLVIDNSATLVSAASLNSTILIGLAGLIVMLIMEVKKIPGSLLIGIAVSTILAVAFGKIARPDKYITFQMDISAISFQLDIIGALKWSLCSAIFSLMFMDMFDSIGTLVACCHRAGMADDKGRIKGIDRLLSIDAIATMFGALLGTSTTTAYIESAAGIEQGGRTGLTAIICGLLFLPAIIFTPIIQMVPDYATAPALIMVGLFMIKEIQKINFQDVACGFPAFIIIVMIALSYSISTGLAYGFTSYVLIRILLGKVKEIKPAMWIIAVLSLLFLTQEWLMKLTQ